jgi:hypothetical protein
MSERLKRAIPAAAAALTCCALTILVMVIIDAKDSPNAINRTPALMQESGTNQMGATQ